jgi:serine/threonine protein phosphatase PrpC
MAKEIKGNIKEVLSFDYTIKQGDKGQDFVITGKYENENKDESFSWIVVADGHGSSLVIDALRKLQWASLINSNAMETEIFIKMRQLGDTMGSGATLSIVRIYSTYVECYWIGDSLIKIFRNDDEIFYSRPHNFENFNELCRMKTNNVQIETLWVLRPFDPITITLQKDAYFLFRDFTSNRFDKINMTRSLGHSGLTGYKFDYTRIEFKVPEQNVLNNDKTIYKIVVASDGLWDVFSESVEDHIIISNNETLSNELVDIAYGRWKQDWDFIKPMCASINYSNINMNMNNIQRFSRTDDIAVCTWVGEIISEPTPTII